MADINVVGDFKWDPPLKGLQEEVKLMAEGRWEPSTKDFEAIAGNSVKCPSFRQLLGVILQRKPKSIGRINIFTHSNSDLIAFSGTLILRSTMVDVMLNTGSGLNLEALTIQDLDNLNRPGLWFQIANNPKKFYLDDIRSRFTSNAIIFLYSCHSGADASFLQYISDTLHVMVDGFKPAIAYCPKYETSPPSIDRKHIGLQSCSVYQTTNFYELAPTAVGKNWMISKRPR